MKNGTAPLLLTVICLLNPVSTNAQWVANGTGVCTLPEGQNHPVIAPDGSGGAIIFFEDSRNLATSGYDVYVQRVNANGVVQWAPGGVPICTAIGDQLYLSIISDGVGGAIMAWGDTRAGGASIYAQRVSSSGIVQWTTNGVSLCTALPEQNIPAVVSDGSQGAVVAWLDTRTGDFDIYAQHVNASGVVQWTATGAPVCAVTGLQHSPFIATDGAGGAIMAWTDERGVAPDIYAQRLNSAGVAQWILNGAPVCQAVRVQTGGLMASDGAGGAIIAWVDGRLGTGVVQRDIYAQRMNGAGVPQWAVNGVVVCNTFGEQGYPTVVTDGADGAILVWHDLRAGNYDLYAQRVNGAGAAQWTANGVAICTAPGFQAFCSNVSDGLGGAIATWSDGRDGSGTNDTYAQRIDGTGTVRWAANGVAVCVQPYDQHAQNLVADGTGGAIVVWDDVRSWDGVTQPSNPYWDIYANRVTGSGWAVTSVQHTPSAGPTLTRNVPNPFSKTTSFDVLLDHAANIVVDVFDVAGRKVRHLDVAHAPVGTTTIAFDGRDQRGRALPSGAYFYRVSANGSHFTRKMLIVR